MTTAAFAALVDARETGTGRWQARCPAHSDNSPSLSIREGRDGRILLHCFAGCGVTAILEGVGLRLPDLFPGPPPSLAEAREAAQERRRRYAEAQAIRRRSGALAARVRKLAAIADSLALKLARLPDDAPEGNQLTRLFQETCDRLHTAEVELEARP